MLKIRVLPFIQHATIKMKLAHHPSLSFESWLSDALSFKVSYIPGDNMIEAVLSWLVLAGSVLYLVGLQPLGHLLLFLPRPHRLQDDISEGFSVGSDRLDKPGWFSTHPAMGAKDDLWIKLASFLW